MIYTGGTTGMPKGVMWRQDDLIHATCTTGLPILNGEQSEVGYDALLEQAEGNGWPPLRAEALRALARLPALLRPFRALTIERIAANEKPTRQSYEDVISSSQRIIDAHPDQIADFPPWAHNFAGTPPVEHLPDLAVARPVIDHFEARADGFRLDARIGHQIYRFAMGDHQASVLVYGDDPRQGVIEGQDFLYPSGRLRFTAPAGYGMSNGTDAVTIGAKGSAARGRAKFVGGAYDGDLAKFLDAAFASLSSSGKAEHVAGQAGSVNGIPTLSATIGAQDSSGGAMDVSVTAYAFAPKTAYALIVMQPRGAGLGDLAPLAQGVRRMSAAEAAAVRPRVISVVKVRAGDSVASLSARMAYTSLQRERFVVLNGLAAGTTTLPVGRKVKLVVWGKPLG